MFFKNVRFDGPKFEPRVENVISRHFRGYLRSFQVIIGHFRSFQLISGHFKSFFTISMTFLPNHPAQNYEYVALNTIPDPKDIGIGTEVLFEQGRYQLKLSDGTSEHSYRWHLGVITGVRKDGNGNFLFAGRHAKGAKDGKWVTWRGYEENFVDMGLNQLRVFPNAMDILQELNSGV